MTDETPQYELSINLQPMIDTMHKRGVVGETDLILQIAIGYMELKNPSRRFLTTDSYQQELDLGFQKINAPKEDYTHLGRLLQLQELFDWLDDSDLESALKTTEDVEDALLRYEI